MPEQNKVQYTCGVTILCPALQTSGQRKSVQDVAFKGWNHCSIIGAESQDPHYYSSH